MNLAGLRGQVEALAKRAEPRALRPHRRTTAEGRQELARILDKIESLPANSPVYREGLPEALEEIDRALARLDTREAAR